MPFNIAIRGTLRPDAPTTEPTDQIGRRHAASGRPRGGRLAAATIMALVLSVVADALLVAAGKAVFPTTASYSHFQFSDYATFTVVGVVAACLSWPVIARLVSRPRRFFARLAVAVSAVLLVPDVFIWIGGQPGRAVAVLAVMHVAIAVLTYWSLMLLAPLPTQKSTPDD